jgi:hypothetical protein
LFTGFALGGGKGPAGGAPRNPRPREALSNFQTQFRSWEKPRKTRNTQKESNPIGFLAGDGFTWRVKSPDDEIPFVFMSFRVISWFQLRFLG